MLLQSIGKKNNLRITYEKLNLEEKAFISSTMFDRRQLLSRQNKLRHSHSSGQAKKGGSFATRTKYQTSFPDLLGRSESVIRGSSSALTVPYARSSSRSARGGSRANSLLRNEANGTRQANKKADKGKLKDVASGERINEVKVPVKQNSLKDEKDVKTRQVRGSGLHVGDIVAYSARFGEEGKAKWKGNEFYKPRGWG